MSTRSQIEFKHIWGQDGKEVTERRTVYRHSDGYPDGVIPDLKEFLVWNKGRNKDIEYQAANFIYWSKRSNLHTGFGICANDEFHVDIEYFYEVVLKTFYNSKKIATTQLEILCYKVSYTGESVTRENLKLIKKVKVKDF